MFGSFKRNQMEKVARRFLESEKANALLSILTTAERTLLLSVQEQHEALGIESLDELPSPEDRAEQIRQLALAKINGRFPEMVVEEYLADVLEHSEEAAEYVDLSEDEWQVQKEQWADDLREQGATGDDGELADRFVQLRYGVSIDQFQDLVVDWPDSRERMEIENVLASGLRTANQGINRTTEVIEKADVDVDDVQED